MAVTTTSLSVKDGSNASQSIATLTDPAGIERYSVSVDSPGVAAYRAGALFTPFATAPVTYFSILGSATKTVRIKRIMAWIVATANASLGVTLNRGTALGTGGTAVSPALTKMDSGTVAAATAVVKHYTTAAQSAATGSTTAILGEYNLTGNLVAETVQIYAPVPVNVLFPESGNGGQSLVLRSTGDIIECQLSLGQSGGANGPPAMQMGYCVEFEEDAS
jgi:hypothetical protein